LKNIDYLILIRGINVGGKNVIKMDELKKLFDEMNFSDVKTHIQTGNIFIKDSEKNKEKLAKKIEDKLSVRLKDEIRVKVLTLTELKEILDHIPNGFGKENDKYKYDIIFIIGEKSIEEILCKVKIIDSKDKLYEGNNVFYVKRSVEKLTGSYIAKIVNIYPEATVRNINVTKKIYEIMAERIK
jgi:uncharacterized protein (DUF1697 family)